MIEPFRFLWKQFNGSQITGITQGIFQFIRNMFDSILDYFHNFSVDTCTSEHLTNIGSMVSMSRPLISIEYIKNFYFTDGKSISEEHGFSTLNSTTGGKFQDLEELSDSSNLPIPEDYYRPLVKAVLDSEAELGSWILLEEVIIHFYERFRPEDDLDYYVVWNADDTISIYLGDESAWPPDDVAFINTIFRALLISGYTPNVTITLRWENYTGG